MLRIPALLLAGLLSLSALCAFSEPQEVWGHMDDQCITKPDSSFQSAEPQRLVAALLAITLGPFGAHRLYLGTGVKVPLIYGITFGGFGILVLIDLGHILFTRDLTAYQHNTNVFMWSGRPSKETTPP